MRINARKLVRRGFNMIEITLALAVLSIGISSVMVLFPVGVNANKTAVAENNLADIAEYMLGFLQAGVASQWTDDGVRTSGFNLPSSYPDSKAEYDDFNSSSHKGERVIRKENGVYLFRQLSQDDDGNDIEDFAMVVQAWQGDFDDMYYFDPSAVKFEQVKASKPKDYEKYCKALCLELSWPAEMPYDEREKRYFRLEIFNDKFTKALDTTE